MDFGIKCLSLPDFKVKTAMYDHSDSIQAATHELLFTWLKKQTDRQEAYKNLLAGLKRAEMNQLASNLRIWVEGSGVISQILEESKWMMIVYIVQMSQISTELQSWVEGFSSESLYYEESEFI